MKEKYRKLPLRSGVGVVLLKNNNQIFVAKRIDNPKNFWQMPQGGVDEGEDYYKAALRELKEETSIENIEILEELKDWTEYELPNYLLGKIWKGKYKGQKQKWFIVRFLGKDSEIDLNTEKPEFIEWRWLNVEKLPNVIVPFKKKVYLKLLPKIKLSMS